jgi:hypothetical protein
LSVARRAGIPWSISSVAAAARTPTSLIPEPVILDPISMVAAVAMAATSLWSLELRFLIRFWQRQLRQRQPWVIYVCAQCKHCTHSSQRLSGWQMETCGEAKLKFFFVNIGTSLAGRSSALGWLCDYYCMYYLFLSSQENPVLILFIVI